MRDAKYRAERIRTSGIARQANETRYAAGRMHAHFKQENMKNEVQMLKSKEI